MLPQLEQTQRVGATINELMLEDGFAIRRESVGEFSSSCPRCGGRDRFRVWPERRGKSRFWCRKCGIHGDAADYLQMVRGMSAADALRVMGVERVEQFERRVLLSPPAPTRTWSQQPAEWHTQADEAVMMAHHTLVNDDRMMAELQKRRGLLEETVLRFRLGITRTPRIQLRAAWGLDPPEPGRERFSIPRGFIIPGTDTAGRIVRVRVRRAGDGPRYWMVPGSINQPLMIRNPPTRPRMWIVVESDLDAMLISQECPDLGVIAAGSAWVRATGPIETILGDAERIWIALDADEAGDKASTWWLKRYPTARRLRPTQKDPGDMWKAGESLSSWIG